MTVSSESYKESHVCNGADTQFAFNFEIFNSDDIKVVLRTVADGTEVILEEGSGAGKYSVTLNDESNLPTAGDITTGTTYSSSYEIHIIRKPAFKQETELTVNGPLPAKTLEHAFDKLMHRIQSNQDENDRSAKIRITDDDDIDIEMALDESADTLTFNVTYSDGATTKSGSITLS